MRPTHTSGISGKIIATAVFTLLKWEESDITLDDLLDDLRENEQPEAAAVSDLLFTYFRHKLFFDRLLLKHAKNGKIRAKMRAIVVCAATQIFFQTGIAPQSAVNVAVDFTKKVDGEGGAKFVNAILRSFLRDETIDKEHIPATFPANMVERWTKAFGAEEPRRMSTFFATNPALTFRLRNGQVLNDLTALGATPMERRDFHAGFQFFAMEKAEPLFKTDFLKNNDIYIQDTATAMPLSLLTEPLQGELLDACAAPGGKTIMLHDLTKGENIRLTASDRSNARLILLNKNLHRCGISCRTTQADAVEFSMLSVKKYDFILADVPCTNTGVFRRRPDALWRFNAQRLADTVDLQAKILDSLSKCLKPNGLLLYSTCSIEAEEDQEQIKRFLESHPHFTLEKQNLLLPSEENDGAFAALLRFKP